MNNYLQLNLTLNCFPDFLLMMHTSPLPLMQSLMLSDFNVPSSNDCSQKIDWVPFNSAECVHLCWLMGEYSILIPKWILKWPAKNFNLGFKTRITVSNRPGWRTFLPPLSCTVLHINTLKSNEECVSAAKKKTLIHQRTFCSY